MQVYNLDDGECYDGSIEVISFEGCPIQILYPSAVSQSLQDVGTKASPVAITSSIAAPIFGRQRSWLVGNSVPAVNPTLPASPIGPSIVEWYLATTDDTNTVSLATTARLQLAGPWTGGAGSILLLQADGAGGWIEGGRNEI